MGTTASIANSTEAIPTANPRDEPKHSPTPAPAADQAPPPPPPKDPRVALPVSFSASDPSDGLVVLDQAGNVWSCNPVAEDLLKRLHPGRAAFTGHNFEVLARDLDHERSTCNVNVGEVQFTLVTLKKPVEKPPEDPFNAIKDEAITAFQEFEMFMITDKEGRIVSVSRGMETTLNVVAAEMLGKRDAESIELEDLEKYNKRSQGKRLRYHRKCGDGSPLLVDGVTWSTDHGAIIFEREAMGGEDPEGSQGTQQLVALLEATKKQLQTAKEAIVQQQEKLDVAEQRLQHLNLADLKGVVMRTTDGNGTQLTVSPTVSGLLGYSVDEMIGNNVWLDVHPDDLPMVHNLHDHSTVTHLSRVQASYRRRHKNGSWVWLEGTSLFHRPSTGGEVTMVMMMERDVTAQCQLNSMESRLHAVLSASPGVLVIEKSRLIVSANAEAAQYLGIANHAQTINCDIVSLLQRQSPTFTSAGAESPQQVLKAMEASPTSGSPTGITVTLAGGNAVNIAIKRTVVDGGNGWVFLMKARPTK